MQLGITIPMERFFKMKKPPYGKKADDLFCWELHVIMLQGRPSLIGVNCGTRFSFVLCGIGPQDRDRLELLAEREICDSFLEAGLTEREIEAYLDMAGAMEVTKTQGRSQVAYLNKAVELVLWNDIAVDGASARQPILNDILNRTPTKCTGDSELERPVDRLLEKLENL